MGEWLDNLIKWAERLRDGGRELPAEWWRQVAAHAARSVPNDIRAAGWFVAVHNDYRLNGELWTFWLFTKDGRAVKGEGRTDAEALDQVREQIGE